MDPGAQVYAPSERDVFVWRAFRATAGALLLCLGVVAVWVGLAGGMSSDKAVGATALALLIYIVAGLVLAFFGLRYILLGIRGRGLRLYERAVEADFYGRFQIWPERRAVPLLRVRVGGSPRLTTAFAITTTGHAFQLPDPFVETADLWHLGTLGLKPLAPGGRPVREDDEEEGPKEEEEDVEARLEEVPAPPRAPTIPVPMAGPPTPPPVRTDEAPAPPPVEDEEPEEVVSDDWELEEVAAPEAPEETGAEAGGEDPGWEEV